MLNFFVCFLTKGIYAFWPCILVSYIETFLNHLMFAQSKMYDHVEQATMLRQEQVLKARGLQSASVEGGPRYVEHNCNFFHLSQSY